MTSYKKNACLDVSRQYGWSAPDEPPHEITSTKSDPQDVTSIKRVSPNQKAPDSMEALRIDVQDDTCAHACQQLFSQPGQKSLAVRLKGGAHALA